MIVEDSCRKDVSNRLRRVQGQIGGILAMLEDGRDCSEVVTQVAASSKALDRAGLRLVANGLQQCAAAAERGEAPPMDPAQLERLFLALS